MTSEFDRGFPSLLVTRVGCARTLAEHVSTPFFLATQV